jgi:hypothetical protein
VGDADRPLARRPGTADPAAEEKRGVERTASSAEHLPPLKHGISESGNYAVHKAPDPYTGRVRVSGLVKLTAAEREYVAWLRAGRKAKGESFPPGTEKTPAKGKFMRLGGIEPPTSRSGGARSIP